MLQGDWFALGLALCVLAVMVHEFKKKKVLVHSEERWRFRWLSWEDHPVACALSVLLQLFVALGSLYVFVASWR